MAIPADIAARVSRETAERLLVLAAELCRWQPKLNLVSPDSLAALWARHIDDSLQLTELEPGAGWWIDLGSGGGFPGLVVAAAEPDLPLVLVESDARKCAYLRTTAARMGVKPRIHHGRIEDGIALPELPRRARVENEDAGRLQPTSSAPGIVSARAIAPLPRLLGYAAPFLAAGAVGLFLKGRTAEAELTEASKSWIFEVDVVPSRTDSAGRILRIRDFAGPRT